MRPGPLTVLGILDHAIDTARRRPRFVLSTIVAGSVPPALGAAVAVHLIRTSGADLVEAFVGAAALAFLAIPRAVGWGAGLNGLHSLLNDEPPDSSTAWRRAWGRAAKLYAVHAWPLMWSLLGVLFSLGPVILALLAASVDSPFRSVGLAITASAAGSIAAIFVLVYVSRRAVALPIAATGPLGAGDSLKKSRDIVRGQTIRAVSLQTYLMLLQVIVWFTFVLAVPWALDFAEILTGNAFLEVRGFLTFRDPSYLAFQGALAFLAMEPVRCFCAGYLHQDGETRRSGADLRAVLEIEEPAALQPEEASWRG